VKVSFNSLIRSYLGILLAGSVAAVVAQDAGQPNPADVAKAFPSKAPYSPYAGRNYPTRPFFGDTHLHTAFSMDAGAFGARLGPPDAFRFARGEEVTSNTGQAVKLSRPLDFLVVADHSDGFGFFPLLMSGAPAVMADPQGRRWNELIHSGQGASAAIDIIRSFGTGTISKAIFPVPGTSTYRGAWQQAVKAADAANDPGRFTAFIGFEWTSNTGGNNLHRNVIFRDDATKALQVEPYTTMKPLGSDDPVDLWKWMAAFEEKTGGEVLAIAHNGNLSNGRMFPIVEAFGRKIDRAYADERAKRERLYEVTQTKGTGEAHPFLSPNDEFADFEIWDKGNLDGSVAKTKEMLEFEYARSALKNGLLLEQKIGVNPYKFGLIGSTDAHTGLAAIEEDNFFGKTATQEPSPERLTATFIADSKTGIKVMDWEVGASGYAAVWAMENTREALFDAMQRRETYATTGTRMVVRFFGGWDFEPKDAHDRMPARVGYAKGVPMGGDLRKAAAGKVPTFLAAALKDPIGANLDRIQIVKGWLDANDEVHEQVFDVAWSGGRKPDRKTGKVPSVGSTVDIENATWSNTIGAPELIAVWRDPGFDPAQRAFYYARVIEIPTPRWTAYDVRQFGNKALPGTRMTVTERAYTSPIWYTPN
jgi:hypothetical protein